MVESGNLMEKYQWKDFSQKNWIRSNVFNWETIFN